MLAEDFEVSEDGLTITFTLRDDVVFHNGEPMEAEDVIASFERWREVSTIGPNYFGEAEFESPEEGVFTVTMPEPMFVAPTLIADPQIMPHIMPAEIIEEAGDEEVSEHIGTGPYMFGAWEADQHIRLDRFEDYTSPEGEPSGMAGEFRTPRPGSPASNPGSMTSPSRSHGTTPRPSNRIPILKPFSESRASSSRS
ncbi:hypothetical protein HGQ17_10295 [Nesterenkonia sp. MY13]|uniref:Solute-binding protein family 5 domain-containing protein n=1 Tax=Nesterenkonia sedimenti TaxID=1463632 RepID=A0A7X8YED5_9MICC|nr:ABC transporter substrate-binding protein [Nesterenkonia sedimenti]NLS10375.1 hypothetical protein [Nesterenkonia sedimenti]